MRHDQADRFKPSSDMHGFTFIELMVVLAIFSIAVLAVAAMQVTSISTNASARISGEASALAANQVEALMALPYDDNNLDPDLNPDHHFTDGAYTVSWTVEWADLDEDGNNDSKTIEVTVQCQNPNARDVSIQYIKPEI
ncbi:MAG: prepilin-type N-terminal cleavage/methylation domain-containing protein [Desulfobacterales bacterium]|jgi:prepilin-type N-terminal cleavage/methylation domain-containing protein